jgi:hypothetical protein
VDKAERIMLVAVLEGYTSEIDKLKKERDEALKEVERLKVRLNGHVDSNSSHNLAHSNIRVGNA